MNPTEREQIKEIVNKLFVYTDEQQWNKLQSEVFTEKVYFDMSSLGGETEQATAKSIRENWEKGFEALDVSFFPISQVKKRVAHANRFK